MRGLRRRVWWEVAIVLAIAIAPATFSAVFSLLHLLTQPTPIAQTQTALNPPAAASILLDLAQRTANILLSLAPVALVLWLTTTRHRSGWRRLGLRPRGLGDVWRGFALVAAIGIPGLGLYALSRMAGLTVRVVAGDATFQWSTVLVLLLSAARAALIEEVIVVAYLSQRLRALRWAPWATILLSALVRGSYHLYQGVPMALGNVVMGVVFAGAFMWLFRRRVAPLVVAHFTIDAISFLGYPLAAALWPQIF